MEEKEVMKRNLLLKCSMLSCHILCCNESYSKNSVSVEFKVIR